MATIPVAGTLASLDKPPVWHPSPSARGSGSVLYPAWALASAPSSLCCVSPVSPGLRCFLGWLDVFQKDHFPVHQGDTSWRSLS